MRTLYHAPGAFATPRRLARGRDSWYNSRNAAIIPGFQVLFLAPAGATEKDDTFCPAGCAVTAE